MNFRRFVVWLMISSFLLARIEVFAQSHEQGVAAGTAANAVIRGLLNAPSATTVVPGYTNAPPETAYAGRPSLGADANAKLAACALTPNDPTCQALRNAVNSANTPRPAISASDPAVAAASRIARNPSIDLGSLAAYYSGCVTGTRTNPAGVQVRQCSRHVGVGNYGCTRNLAVDVTRTPSCADGQWFASASDGASSLAVQCLPNRPSSRQHFRARYATSDPQFFDYSLAGPALFPAKTLTMGSHNDPVVGLVDISLFLVDNRCVGDSCSINAVVTEDVRHVCDDSGCRNEPPFLPVHSACPAGSVSGDHLMALEFCILCVPRFLDLLTCYAPYTSSTPSGIPKILATDLTGSSPSIEWYAGSARSLIGWKPNPAYGPFSVMRLGYTRPHHDISTTDLWTTTCPPGMTGGRCAPSGSPICIEGPGTRNVAGVSVTRSCWAYQVPHACAGARDPDQCAPLAAAGCTPLSSSCKATHPVTGACEVFDEEYACPVAAETVTTASNCPSNVFCLGTSCFNIGYSNDADFGRTMSMLEAGREAGVYLDSDRLQVFKGEPNRCRDRLLKNCCYADAAGAGMTNQSVFGSGTRLVYDILMNSENREFVVQGMSALLTGAGFSGTFSAYGFTIAANGAALPAGSTVLYASSATAGQGIVVAFDPWSLVIAVIIYVILSLTSCNEEEARLALKEGASLCHSVGTYCSSCLRVLGVCVSCVERTTSKCCFNSMLARIVNEQGRVQVGKGWGGSESPDCSGFTVAQLQSLDFAAMDLTEFYASLVPTSPNLATLQTNNASRVPACYYGQGRC
ncbi:MAG: type-F conjugative transfer system mating-pair stabilization protein TraN [Burkholderiaceae bacterium]|nr:type-F conjugative transfer system mating-pair stabilization protein TraN [Burkholderiaceae bacterium]